MDRLAQSPLRLALGQGKLSKGKKSKPLKYKVPDDEHDADGLSSPAMTRKRRLVLQPLVQKPTADASSEKARKAFEAALQRRNFQQVLWLIENDDVPAMYETIGGETALLAAIGARDSDTFRLVMQCGVSIDTPNRHGYTPLMKAIAAAAPFAETADASRNPTTSTKTKPPRRKPSHLPICISNNRQPDSTDGLDQEVFDNAMVTSVLAHQPNLHAQDAAGQTAFDWATRTRNSDALALLESHQQRLRQEHQDFADRDGRLQECVALLRHHDELATEMETLLHVPLLLEPNLLALLHGIPVTMTAETVATALQDYHALQAASTTEPLSSFMGDFLLDRETRDGWTPLTKAAACGFVDAARLLLTMGADATHEGKRLKHTPLTWASYCGHEGVVLLLLRQPGVRVDYQTVEGKTALIHAVANKQLPIVRHLCHAMHEICIKRASGKETFHANEATVRGEPERRKASRWGGAWSASASASGKRKPGKEEWHELFLPMLAMQDTTGRDAMAYAAMFEDAHGDEIQRVLQHARQQATAHKEYVATHQQNTLATPCKYACDGCDFIAPLDLLPTHELHECVKRKIQCEQCTKWIVQLEQHVHDATQCDHRFVSCVNRQFGCDVRVVFSNRDAHGKDHCRKRRVTCRLGCGEDTLTFDTLTSHETTQCVRRLVECPLQCGVAAFPANQAGKHKRQLCSKRLIPCTSGCGMAVAADQMTFHVGSLCELRKVSCRWESHGCTQRIGGSVDSRHHHEQRECMFRLVECRNIGCGLSGQLLACFLEDHYAWQCRLEPKTCGNGCGVEPLPSYVMDTHIQSDSGDCDQRKTRCRLDLCGKTLRLYDPQDRVELPQAGGSGVVVSMRALRLRLQRTTSFVSKLVQRNLNMSATSDDEDDNASLPLCLSVPKTRDVLLAWLTPLQNELQHELAQVEAMKQSRAVRVRVLSFNTETNNHLLEFQRDGHSQWLNLSGKEYDIEMANDPTLGVSASAASTATTFQCGLVVAHDLTHHEATQCTLRLVACPLACGQRLPAQSIAHHLSKRCNLRNATCRLGCGLVIPFVNLSQHEDTHCAHRQVCCEYCHLTMPHRSLATHLSTYCEQVPRRCRFGCSALVPSAQFHAHETSECPKRLIACSQCNKQVWFGEQQSHANDECALRVFGACDAGCGKVLRVNERTYHLLHDCTMRVISCPQCHESMPWQNLAQHKSILCIFRDVFCRRGCGATLREVDIKTHEDSQCDKRLVHCPTRCGDQLPFTSVHEHVALQCTMRIVQCPHGCGDSLFAYQCESHLKRCRQRLCECGAGSKQCARPIRLWLSQRKLVKCQAHKESGLLWALKTQDEDLVSYFVSGLDNEYDESGVNMEFANGFTPLAIASSLGTVAIAKILLRFGANVNQETSRGRTPLMEACLASDPAMVALLLENRASVSHVNRHGQKVQRIAEFFAAAAVSSSSIAQDDEKQAKAKKVLELLRQQEELDKDLRALFCAISCSDYEYMASLLQYSTIHNSTNNQTAFSGLEMVRSLEKQVLEKQTSFSSVQKELGESVTQLNESIADTEAKTTQTQRLRERVHDSTYQIATIDSFHDDSIADSNILEADLLGHIREITAHDIAKLLNVNTPPDEYLVVMKSICLFCGVTPRGRRNASEYTDLEWWKTAQALLMDRGLLSKLRGYRKQNVTPDVMAKVRRECLRTPAFAASTAAFEAINKEEAAEQHGNKEKTGDSGASPRHMKGALRRMSRLPRKDALRGDIVGILATWVKGVEIEYKATSDRQTLTDKKRRLAVCLEKDEQQFRSALFDMQVATRSLPARQEEVQSMETRVAAAEKELFAATQRLRAYRLVQCAALNGHTALTFACSIGNDAMVHLLLTHGACAGPSPEERHACAALIQLTFREFAFAAKQKKLQKENRSQSDQAIDALVRNVAQTFLLSHYQRKRKQIQTTHRVAIHEAIYNGHPEIAQILLAHGDTKLWHKTHVFPIRAVPGSLAIVSHAQESKSARELKKRGGWTLVPLTGKKDPPIVHRIETEDEPSVPGTVARAEAEINPSEVEARLAPMTLEETLRHAQWKCDSQTFRRDHGGWSDPHATRYSDTATFLHNAMAKLYDLQAAQQREIHARKNVAKKTMALQALHGSLEKCILARDFKGISLLFDDGAFADYETSHDGLTALMATCIEERYVENSDGSHVLAVAFLMDRPTNHPFVNFENSTGKTALSVAAANGTILCAHELVELGAKVNLATRRRGQTALMVAASHGQLAFVQYLLRHKETDVMMRDAEGKTALEYAKAGGFVDVQQVLGAAMSGGNRGRVFASVSALYGVCKWGCGFMGATHGHTVDAHSVVVEDTNPLEIHERDSCPKRIVKCPFDCGILTLWAEAVETHIKSDCAQRIVTCPQPKCGAQVVFQKLRNHDTQECEFRIVLCECGEKMTHQKHVIHALNTCPQRLVPCPNECHGEEEGEKATAKMSLVRFAELKDHTRNTCPHRRVRCRNGCAANELLFKDRDHHEQQLCGVRRVQCKWGCAEPVLANSQLVHETDECVERELKCPNKCGDTVRFLELDDHTTTTCAKRQTLCTLGCGRKVPLHLMDAHHKSECRRRVVHCCQCNGSLHEIDLQTHQSTTCPQRLAICGLCGQANITHTEMARHRKDECRMRVVTCRFNCYTTQPLLAHAKLRHEQFECTFRPIFCPLGCGETIIAHTSKKHERQCTMRIVSCGNGCGVELRERDRVDHEQQYCSASTSSAKAPSSRKR